MGVSSTAEHMWLLPSEPTSVVEARTHVVGVCDGMAAGNVEVVRLLVSELVTNAVQHGAGEVVLVVAREGDGVRVEVHDGSPVLPAISESSTLMERGWGLRLVENMASSWGVLPRDDGQPGKRVWFALT